MGQNLSEQTRSGGSRRGEQRSWLYRHPALTLLSIVFAGLALLAIAAEGGARVFLRTWGPTVGGERTTYAQYDQQLGWSHRPGTAERFTRREFSIDVRISSQGLRDREYPRERSAKKRVLVLGDSFGWGYGVELSERFDEVIEARRPDWEIINASVSGYGTDQQLLYLQQRGVEYRPDVVLLLLYQNDFANNRAATQYYTNKPYFELSGGGALDLHNVPVPPPTLSQRAARWLGGTYVWGRMLEGALGVVDQIRGGPDSGRESHPDDELTYRLLHEMARTSREAGAQLIVVSVPMSNVERKETLRRRADESGFRFATLDSVFSESGSGLIFPENRHWTPAGHEVAARTISTLLADALAEDPPPPGADRVDQGLP